MSTNETPTEAPKPKKKRIRGDAITRLARASSSKVRDKSEEIIDALVRRVIEGDVNCAKLLVTFIERLPPPKHKYRSAALELLKSGPWQKPAATGCVPLEDDESKELEQRLGKDFVDALENYRRAEREIAIKNASSQPQNPEIDPLVAMQTR